MEAHRLVSLRNWCWTTPFPLPIAWPLVLAVICHPTPVTHWSLSSLQGLCRLAEPLRIVLKTATIVVSTSGLLQRDIFLVLNCQFTCCSSLLCLNFCFGLLKSFCGIRSNWFCLLMATTSAAGTYASVWVLTHYSCWHWCNTFFLS